ncbi:hypothetical protein [Desulfonema magnum]|uniref:Uncharacterized protein n=1 Tax=Desulfonema magnum TaxID=45655 RepID=A0A975GSF4_9BACT|nr:hypothetical protein [Desulfonema magnum]QTA91979.1 Uncharacterized protein dnm_080520 [Desulfonema magnum]
MLSVPGIYEDGKVSVSQDVPIQGRADVIVTFLEDTGEASVKKNPLRNPQSDLIEDDLRDFLESYDRKKEREVSEKLYSSDEAWKGIEESLEKTKPEFETWQEATAWVRNRNSF